MAGPDYYPYRPRQRPPQQQPSGAWPLSALHHPVSSRSTCRNRRLAGQVPEPARRAGCPPTCGTATRRLIDPMSPARKHKMCSTLLVRDGGLQGDRGSGFPSASQTDFPTFVRELNRRRTGCPPTTVPGSRSSPPGAARDLIERFGPVAWSGARAMANRATCTTRPAPIFRRVVFRIDREEWQGGWPSRGHPARHESTAEGTPGPEVHRATDFGYEYSPEIFMDTELDFRPSTGLVARTSWDTWQPEAGPGRSSSNLPCHGSSGPPPNVYADQRSSG